MLANMASSIAHRAGIDAAADGEQFGKEAGYFGKRCKGS